MSVHPKMMTQAAKDGNWKLVEEIALAFPKAFFDGYHYKDVALLAIQQGQTEALSALLKSGVSAEARDTNSGKTLLQHAEMAQQPAIIKLLLLAGADNQQLKDATTPKMKR